VPHSERCKNHHNLGYSVVNRTIQAQVYLDVIELCFESLTSLNLLTDNQAKPSHLCENTNWKLIKANGVVCFKLQLVYEA
jgi:hypothetical protein